MGSSRTFLTAFDHRAGRISESSHAQLNGGCNHVSESRWDCRGRGTLSLNTTGDLALRWEVARDRRLGRHEFSYIVLTQTRSSMRAFRFPVGGSSYSPGRLCSSCPSDFFTSTAGILLDYSAVRHSQRRTRGTTDEEPALSSAGPPGPVESVLPCFISPLLRSDPRLQQRALRFTSSHGKCQCSGPLPFCLLLSA